MRKSKYMRCIPLEQVNLKVCKPYNFTSSRFFVTPHGEVFEISKDLTEARFLPVTWNKKNEQQLFVDFGSFMKDMDILIYEHFCPVAQEESYRYIEIIDSSMKCADNIRPISEYEYNDRYWIDNNDFREIPPKMPRHEKPVKKSGSR